MTKNATCSERTASFSQSANRRSGGKPYRPPTLVKGPILSAVTAADGKVSGVILSDSEQ